MLRALLYVARSSNGRMRVFKTQYRGSTPRRANLYSRALPVGTGLGLKILRTPTRCSSTLLPSVCVNNMLIVIWAVKHND